MAWYCTARPGLATADSSAAVGNVIWDQALSTVMDTTAPLPRAVHAVTHLTTFTKVFGSFAVFRLMENGVEMVDKDKKKQKRLGNQWAETNRLMSDFTESVRQAETDTLTSIWNRNKSDSYGISGKVFVIVVVIIVIYLLLVFPALALLLVLLLLQCCTGVISFMNGRNGDNCKCGLFCR